MSRWAWLPLQCQMNRLGDGRDPGTSAWCNTQSPRKKSNGNSPPNATLLFEADQRCWRRISSRPIARNTVGQEETLWIRCSWWTCSRWLCPQADRRINDRQTISGGLADPSGWRCTRISGEAGRSHFNNAADHPRRDPQQEFIKMQ